MSKASEKAECRWMIWKLTDVKPDKRTKKLAGGKTGGWFVDGTEIDSRDGYAGRFGGYMDFNPDLRPPVVGDLVKVYGAFGSPTRGMDLLVDDEWKEVWFNTQAEMDAAHKAWVEDYHRRQKEEFEKNKDRLDALYETLPLPLKRRIDRFRAEDPDFRWKEESYEMYACGEAARLVKRCMDPEFGKTLKEHRIKAPRPEVIGVKQDFQYTKEDGYLDWEDTPLGRLSAFNAINSVLNGYNYKLMEKIMPEMDQGHSGNTWGHAVMFARILIEKGDEAPL